MLENVELGGGDDFVLGDLVDVVEDGRLEIREVQVEIAKFQGEKERSREEKKVLTALAFTGEVGAGKCQLKLGENQEANSITETAVLKVPRTNKNRDLYRAICEIPQNRAKFKWEEARN